MKNFIVEGELVSNLDNLLRKYIATDVLMERLVPERLYSAKHESCIVRARVSPLRHDNVKAVCGFDYIGEN